MATILFFVSMFMLGGLIAFKIFELKVKRVDFLVNLFIKGDKKIHELRDLMIFKYNRYKKIANIFVFEFLPSYLYELLVKTKDYVAKRYYEAGNNFRGRRILKSNGSVSAFLEQLSDKNTIEKKL
jgi:hypothetical protein